MKISDVMTRNPRTCPADATCADAARALWESDCGSMPVVDPEGRLIAMITDRDICMAALTQGKALHAVPVWVAASRDVVAAADTDAVEAARTLMDSRRVRRIPIIDDDRRVVGVVSMHDLVRHARTGAGNGGVRAGAVVHTLASIGQPASR